MNFQLGSLMNGFINIGMVPDEVDGLSSYLRHCFYPIDLVLPMISSRFYVPNMDLRAVLKE